MKLLSVFLMSGIVLGGGLTLHAGKFEDQKKIEDLARRRQAEVVARQAAQDEADRQAAAAAAADVRTGSALRMLDRRGVELAGTREDLAQARAAGAGAAGFARRAAATAVDLRTQLTAMDSQLKAAHTKMNSLNTEIGNIKDELRSSTAAVSAHRLINEGFVAQLRGQSAALNAGRDEVQRLREKADGLGLDLAEATGDNKVLRDEASEAQTRIIDLTRRLAAGQVALIGARRAAAAALEQHEDELREARVDGEEESMKADAAGRRVAELTGILAQLQADNERELAAVQAQLDKSKQDAVVVWTPIVARLNDERKALRAQVDSLSADLERSTTEAAAQRGRADAAEGRVISAVARADHAEDGFKLYKGISDREKAALRKQLADQRAAFDASQAVWKLQRDVLVADVAVKKADLDAAQAELNTLGNRIGAAVGPNLIGVLKARRPTTRLEDLDALIDQRDRLEAMLAENEAAYESARAAAQTSFDKRVAQLQAEHVRALREATAASKDALEDAEAGIAFAEAISARLREQLRQNSLIFAEQRSQLEGQRDAARVQVEGLAAQISTLHDQLGAAQAGAGAARDAAELALAAQRATYADAVAANAGLQAQIERLNAKEAFLNAKLCVVVRQTCGDTPLAKEILATTQGAYGQTFSPERVAAGTSARAAAAASSRAVGVGVSGSPISAMRSLGDVTPGRGAAAAAAEPDASAWAVVPADDYHDAAAGTMANDPRASLLEPAAEADARLVRGVDRGSSRQLRGYGPQPARGGAGARPARGAGAGSSLDDLDPFANAHKAAPRGPIGNLIEWLGSRLGKKNATTAA